MKNLNFKPIKKYLGSFKLKLIKADLIRLVIDLKYLKFVIILFKAEYKDYFIYNIFFIFERLSLILKSLLMFIIVRVLKFCVIPFKGQLNILVLILLLVSGIYLKLIVLGLFLNIIILIMEMLLWVCEYLIKYSQTHNSIIKITNIIFRIRLKFIEVSSNLFFFDWELTKQLLKDLDKSYIKFIRFLERLFRIFSLENFLKVFFFFVVLPWAVVYHGVRLGYKFTLFLYKWLHIILRRVILRDILQPLFMKSQRLPRQKVNLKLLAKFWLKRKIWDPSFSIKSKEHVFSNYFIAKYFYIEMLIAKKQLKYWQAQAEKGDKSKYNNICLDYIRKAESFWFMWMDFKNETFLRKKFRLIDLMEIIYFRQTLKNFLRNLKAFFNWK